MSDDVKRECWLARFAPGVPCEGRLVRAHLLPRRELKAVWERAHHGAVARLGGGPVVALPWKKREDLVLDPRTWVWACGGIMGQGGHHGMLDHSRTLRVPRSALPAGVEEVARLVGLEWWLEREYGPFMKSHYDARCAELSSKIEREFFMGPGEA